jgi:TfoX/Sxy family transcriptional regulator of competence genes
VPVTYDLDLADRVRAVVAAEGALTEKRMFGGLAFLVRGHMAVAVSGQGGLLLRVDPASAGSLLGPAVSRAEMRGRELNGWLHVRAAAVETDDELRAWVAHGLAYVHSLPPK